MIFCLFFISNRLFLTFLIGWVSVICLVVVFSSDVHSFPFLARLLNPINLEFVMGMVVAYLARRVSVYFAPLILFGGVLLALLLFLLPISDESRVLFGFSFSAFVLGAVLLERQTKLVLSHWMVKLGDASYSIYLTHNQLVSLTSKWLGRLHGFTSWWFGMFVGVVASILVGVMYHLYVEKPVIRLFRQQINRIRGK